MDTCIIFILGVIFLCRQSPMYHVAMNHDEISQTSQQLMSLLIWCQIRRLDIKLAMVTSQPQEHKFT
jgi:hypothetical protein